MVHKARAEQLRNAAERLGISASEVIERLIELGIEHNVIPDELPGFNIRAEFGAGVRSVLGEVHLPLLPPEHARLFADALLFHAAKEGHGRHASKPANFHDASIVMMGRLGRGLFLTRQPLNATVEKVGMTLEMARDVARRIKAAADKADAWRVDVARQMAEEAAGPEKAARVRTDT